MQNVISKFIWTINGSVAAAIVLSMMLVFPGTAQAQSRTMSEASQQQLEQRLVDVSARLNLTDSQKNQVKPILRASMQKQMDILKRYGISRSEKPSLSFRQKLSLRDEISSQRDDTNSKLSQILDNSQMHILASIQAEQRAQMMKRIRG